MTTIYIDRLDQHFHFAAHNEHGNTIEVDADPKIGGHNLGMRPMQLLLTAIGTCSVFDMIYLLKKQRQKVEDIKVKVVGDRADGVPSPWKSIDMHFTFYGKLNHEKVKKAVQQGVEKYCSVGLMLEKTAKISWTYEIIEPK
jgi:putative redox protein